MKKPQTLTCIGSLAVLTLVFASCSKDQESIDINPGDTNREEIVILPTTFKGIHHPGALLETRQSDLKATKVTSYYKYDGNNVLYEANDFTFRNDRVLYVDNYLGPDKNTYTGYLQYKYNTNGLINVVYHFDSQWNKDYYYSYIYEANNPLLIKYIALYNVSGTLLYYLNFVRTGFYGDHFDYVNCYNNRGNLVYSLSLVYDKYGKIVTLTNKTYKYIFLYDANQFVTQKITTSAADLSVVSRTIYSQAADRLNITDYNSTGDFIGSKVFMQVNETSSYDPIDPVSQFNINYLIDDFLNQ